MESKPEKPGKSDSKNGCHPVSVPHTEAPPDSEKKSVWEKILRADSASNLAGVVSDLLRFFQSPVHDLETLFSSFLNRFGIELFLSFLRCLLTGKKIHGKTPMEFLRWCLGWAIVSATWIFVIFLLVKLYIPDPWLNEESRVRLVAKAGKPLGIDLTMPDALKKLQASKEITNLKIWKGNWDSFMLVVPFSDPRISDLVALIKTGAGEYIILDEQYRGRGLRGWKYFLDAQNRECERAAFSSRFFDQAVFVIRLLDDDSSAQFTKKGNVLLFHRLLDGRWNENVCLIP